TSSGRVVVVVGGRVVVVVVVVSAAGVVATSVGMASDAAVGGGDCRRAQAVRRNTTANVVGSRRVFASRTGTGSQCMHSNSIAEERNLMPGLVGCDERVQRRGNGRRGMGFQGGGSRLSVGVANRIVPCWSCSIRYPRRWTTMWWWYQHRVIRLSGWWEPPWLWGTMWWGWRRWREVHPGARQAPSLQAT